MALDADSKVHSVKQITNFDGFNTIVGMPGIIIHIVIKNNYYTT